MICVLVFTVCVSICSVFATDISYDIEEIGMTLNIPNNMQVITRGTPEDDIVFSTFGLDYQGIMNDFENRNIYLQAADAENFLTLTVTKTTTEESKFVDNYNKLSEDELNRIKDTFMAIPSYQECEEKDINGYKYLCLLVSEQTNGNYVYSQQYSTVVNGDNYIVSLQAPNAQQLTNDDKATLDRIMKSVEIKEVTFFNQYGATIILIVSCVIAVAGVLVLFVFLFRYIRDPKRKDDDILHQLAHEHKITETTKIPRKKLRKYMSQTEPEPEEFIDESELVEEKVYTVKSNTEDTYNDRTISKDENDDSYYGDHGYYGTETPIEYN
jgi:hypothetical protein